MTHSLGPWTVQDNSDQLRGQVRVDSDSGCIADCGSNRQGLSLATLEDMRANARLIAEAPELLDFARRVATHFADTDSPLGMAARDVIARATL